MKNYETTETSKTTHRAGREERIVFPLSLNSLMLNFDNTFFIHWRKI